jgi:hypothetical protein
MRAHIHCNLKRVSVLYSADLRDILPWVCHSPDFVAGNGSVTRDTYHKDPSSRNKRRKHHGELEQMPEE